MQEGEWEMLRNIFVFAIFGFMLGASPLATAASPSKSLYDRLGGKAAITAVVERFATTQLADKRIAKHYKLTNIAEWKGHLIALICKAAGGPCAYSGRPMTKAHARRNISNGEFNWTAAHLVDALNHFKVPAKEQDELVAIFVSLKDDVVGQ
jgi:hemoglobin